MPGTPAYPDQGYSEYGYGGQDHRAAGDAASYPDQGYSTFGYGGQEQSYRGGARPARQARSQPQASQQQGSQHQASQYPASQYPDQDQEATASHQAVSSFPYETDPPTRREQRRRRGR